MLLIWVLGLYSIYLGLKGVPISLLWGLCIYYIATWTLWEEAGQGRLRRRVQVHRGAGPRGCLRRPLHGPGGLSKDPLIYVHTYTYINVYTFMHAYTYINKQILYIYIYTHNRNIYAPMHICTYVYTYIYACIFIRTLSILCTRCTKCIICTISGGICICMCICISVYVNLYMSTHVYASVSVYSIIHMLVYM